MLSDAVGKLYRSCQYLALCTETAVKCDIFRSFINTYMRTKSPTTHTKHKLELDEQLFQTLNNLGLVENISDFSRQMGRNDSYYGCMRSRGYGLHVGSLTFLVSVLSQKMDATRCVRERAKLRAGITAINETIQAKCRIRELELHG